MLKKQWFLHVLIILGLIAGMISFPGKMSQFQIQAKEETVKNTTLASLRPLSNIKQVATGDATTCALTNGGGVKCWGYAYYGQLGNGLQVDQYIPVDVLGLSENVTSISVNGFSGCAVINNGAQCWGDNDVGQMGNGHLGRNYIPMDVTGLTSGVKTIAAGGAHVCALMDSGVVKCWGNNFSGQLGDGTNVSKSIPVDVVGLDSDIVSISAGSDFTCVITNKGTVKCWGNNASQQLGDGTTTDRYMPVNVVGLNNDIVAISNGAQHTCALTASGGVKCWGANYYGQLGMGSITNDPLPPNDVIGLSSGVKAITIGSHYGCALTNESLVKCWGTNIGTEPVAIGGLSNDTIQMSAGGGQTCALAAEGTLRCWGFNSSGQVGDGTTITRESPVQVMDYDLPTSSPTPTPRPTNTPIASFNCSVSTQITSIHKTLVSDPPVQYPLYSATYSLRFDLDGKYCPDKNAAVGISDDSLSIKSPQGQSFSVNRRGSVLNSSLNLFSNANYDVNAVWTDLAKGELTLRFVANGSQHLAWQDLEGSVEIEIHVKMRDPRSGLANLSDSIAAMKASSSQMQQIAIAIGVAGTLTAIIIMWLPLIGPLIADACPTDSTLCPEGAIGLVQSSSDQDSPEVRSELAQIYGKIITDTVISEISVIDATSEINSNESVTATLAGFTPGAGQYFVVYDTVTLSTVYTTTGIIKSDSTFTTSFVLSKSGKYMIVAWDTATLLSELKALTNDPSYTIKLHIAATFVEVKDSSPGRSNPLYLPIIIH